MVKIRSLTAKWRKGWPPEWQMRAAEVYIEACAECTREQRPVSWLF